jgi:hypothetical protein
LEKIMTTNNKIDRKKIVSTALTERKREIMNVRRRLRRAEDEVDAARVRAYAASRKAERAEDRLWKLLDEMDEATGTKIPNRNAFFAFDKPTRVSKIALGKVSGFLAATNTAFAPDDDEKEPKPTRRSNKTRSQTSA